MSITRVRRRRFSDEFASMVIDLLTPYSIVASKRPSFTLHMFCELPCLRCEGHPIGQSGTITFAELCLRHTAFIAHFPVTHMFKFIVRLSTGDRFDLTLMPSKMRQHVVQQACAKMSFSLIGKPTTGVSSSPWGHCNLRECKSVCGGTFATGILIPAKCGRTLVAPAPSTTLSVPSRSRTWSKWRSTQ